MDRTNTLQQFSRYVAVMAMQCRYMFILLALFIFSISAIYASLTLVSDAIQSRLVAGFSAGIFLKAGIAPDKTAIEKARAISGVAKLEVIEPTSAPGIIEKNIGKPLPLLTNGIATDRFPYTVIVQLTRQHLSKAADTISLVAKEIKGVQEIRYQAEGLKKALGTLERLQAAQMQLGIMLFFALLAGCLSIVRLSVRFQPLYPWQYTLTGILSGSAAALLMLLSVHLVSTATGWKLSLDGQLYWWIATAGLISGLCGDLSAWQKRRGRISKRLSEQEATQVMEVMP